MVRGQDQLDRLRIFPFLPHDLKLVYGEDLEEKLVSGHAQSGVIELAVFRLAALHQTAF